MIKGILEQYAERFGWPLLRMNILVEGTSDQAYFRAAAALYRGTHGKALLGTDLSLFPTGDGDEGGAYGIQEQFQTIRNLARVDTDQRGKTRFHFVALLDGDPTGKQIAREIVGSNRSFELWRDVFWLQRTLPRTTLDPKNLQAAIDASNKDCKSLDTVIEDLVTQEVYDLFAGSDSRSRATKIVEHNGRRHYHMPVDLKPIYRRFVEGNADLESLRPMVEVLMSLRYYLGLPTAGV